jgi:hypothetical protein
MSLKGQSTTFVFCLFSLIRIVFGSEEEEQKSEEFSFFSHEFITSALFIIYLVAILVFLFSHCKKAETLTQSESPKADEKLKQQ